jgi:hypothetical protein
MSDQQGGFSFPWSAKSVKSITPSEVPSQTISNSFVLQEAYRLGVRQLVIDGTSVTEAQFIEAVDFLAYVVKTDTYSYEDSLFAKQYLTALESILRLVPRTERTYESLQQTTTMIRNKLNKSIEGNYAHDRELCIMLKAFHNVLQDIYLKSNESGKQSFKPVLQRLLDRLPLQLTNEHTTTQANAAVQVNAQARAVAAQARAAALRERADANARAAALARAPEHPPGITSFSPGHPLPTPTVVTTPAPEHPPGITSFSPGHPLPTPTVVTTPAPEHPPGITSFSPGHPLPGVTPGPAGVPSLLRGGGTDIKKRYDHDAFASYVKTKKRSFR